MSFVEKRAPFVADEAKFSTQRLITYALLLIFTGVVIAVFIGADKAERSTIMQTVINFAMLTIGYWFGTSKSSADKDVTAAKLARDAVTPGPETPAGVVPAAEVVKETKP